MSELFFSTCVAHSWSCTSRVDCSFVSRCWIFVRRCFTASAEGLIGNHLFDILLVIYTSLFASTSLFTEIDATLSSDFQNTYNELWLITQFCVRLKNKGDFQSLGPLVSGTQMYAEQRNNTKKWDVKTHLVLNLELFSLVYCVQSSELHYGLNLAWSYTHKVPTWGVIPWQRYKMGTLSLSGPWSRHRSFFREFFSWNRRKMKFDNQNSMKTGGWSVCRTASRQRWLPGNIGSERN